MTSSSGTIHLQLQQSHAIRSNQLFSATEESIRGGDTCFYCVESGHWANMCLSHNMENICQFTWSSTVYIWELHLFHFTYLWDIFWSCFVIKWSWRKSSAITVWMSLYLLDQRYVFVLGYPWLPWGAQNRVMRWHLLQFWRIWALGERVPSILQHLKHSLVTLVELCKFELLFVSQASLTFRHIFWFGFVMKYSSQRKGSAIKLWMLQSSSDQRYSRVLGYAGLPWVWRLKMKT